MLCLCLSLFFFVVAEYIGSFVVVLNSSFLLLNLSKDFLLINVN